MDAFAVIGQIFNAIRVWMSSKILPGFAPFSIWDIFVASFVAGIILLLWRSMYSLGGK